MYSQTDVVSLPPRQRVLKDWMKMLPELCPGWDNAGLESLACHLLDDLYGHLDDRNGRCLSDMQARLTADIATAPLSCSDMARMFIALRSVFRHLLGKNEPVDILRVLERLDEWSDRTIARFDATCLRNAQKRRVEVVQRIAQLNTLNHCAAALNVSLDLVSAFNATAQLAQVLTNADLCIVYQRQDNFLQPRASAGKPQPSEQPIEIDTPKLLEPFVVDERQQDVPIEVVRRRLGVSQAQALYCNPLTASGEVIGKLTVVFTQPKRFTVQELRLQEIFANHAGQALYNAHLYERLSDLTAAHERRRIAGEMHDTMLQTLVSLNINLRVLLRYAHQGEWKQVLALLEDSRRLGKIAIQEGRDTLNNLHDYRNAGDDDLLQALQPELIIFTERSGIKPRLTVIGEPSVPLGVGHQLRRLLGEALANIQRHAFAETVTVAIGSRDEELQIQICDDGVGFHPHRVDQQASFGLSGMRERSRLINAQLIIDSAPGKGTRVTIRYPLNNATDL